MSSPHGLTRYKSCRCPRCRAANAAWHRNRARQIAYGRWEPLTDATGTRRRIGALLWNGWSMGQLGARLGADRKEIHRILFRSPKVTPPTAEKVRGLYDDLWDQPPPEGTRHEKMAATKARRYAREHGFAPPLAWDDDAIDNPGSRPACRWERGAGRERGTLADEALELTGFGLDLGQAAERLGVDKSTLSTTLSRERAKAQEAATGDADDAAA